eukprot:gene11-biopygen10726
MCVCPWRATRRGCKIVPPVAAVGRGCAGLSAVPPQLDRSGTTRSRSGTADRRGTPPPSRIRRQLTQRRRTQADEPFNGSRCGGGRGPGAGGGGALGELVLPDLAEVAERAIREAREHLQPGHHRRVEEAVPRRHVHGALQQQVPHALDRRAAGALGGRRVLEVAQAAVLGHQRALPGPQLRQDALLRAGDPVVAPPRRAVPAGLRPVAPVARLLRPAPPRVLPEDRRRDAERDRRGVAGGVGEGVARRRLRLLVRLLVPGHVDVAGAVHERDVRPEAAGDGAQLRPHPLPEDGGLPAGPRPQRVEPRLAVGRDAHLRAARHRDRARLRVAAAVEERPQGEVDGVQLRPHGVAVAPRRAAAAVLPAARVGQ